MNNFNTKEYCTDFSTIPFSTVDGFDSPDELAVLNKSILDCIDPHAPTKENRIY